jgi:hypothetical protein
MRKTAHDDALTSPDSPEAAKVAPTRRFPP